MINKTEYQPSILLKMFSGMLKKHGYTVQFFTTLDIVDFKNNVLEGEIWFDKENKRQVISWVCKAGYELNDIPFTYNESRVTSVFHSPNDLLNFIQRRLLFRKLE